MKHAVLSLLVFGLTTLPALADDVDPLVCAETINDFLHAGPVTEEMQVLGEYTGVDQEGNPCSLKIAREWSFENVVTVLYFDMNGEKFPVRVDFDDYARDRKVKKCESRNLFSFKAEVLNLKTWERDNGKFAKRYEYEVTLVRDVATDLVGFDLEEKTGRWRLPKSTSYEGSCQLGRNALRDHDSEFILF